MSPSDPGLEEFAKRTQIIIPAYNEEECVGDVVRRLRRLGFPNIRVVDNASTDATGRVARDAGAEVIFDPVRGYGQACWTGGLHIPEGIDWILYCNADASDDMEAYPEFARLATGHDLILGARLSARDRRHLSPAQRFGNWLAPFLIRLLWGHQYSDLGPQRAIRLSAYNRLMLRDRGFGWTVEMQVRALEEGLQIVEIPVRNYPRPAGKSKISGNLRGSLLAGLIILQTISSLFIKRRGSREKVAVGQKPDRTASLRTL